MKLVTVVYEIQNETEWLKTNPLNYEHNGLKAVSVEVGDAIESKHALEDVMPFFLDEFKDLGEFATDQFKEAMERAIAAIGGGKAE